MDNNEDIKQLSMAELIERSSLGTPAAVALRRRTPPEVVAEILAGINAEMDGP